MQSFKLVMKFKSCRPLFVSLLALTVCFRATETSAKELINRTWTAEDPLSFKSDSKILAQDMKNFSSIAPIRYAETSRRPNEYILPSWFDYNQFKRFFGKVYSKPEENEIHKRIYLRTALKVFEQRALYRTNRSDTLPSINELSDMTTIELLALKRSQQQVNRTRQRIAESVCCTYDQVQRRIVQLLDETSGEVKTDLALSRAYVDELQQKPILDVESEHTIGGDFDLQPQTLENVDVTTSSVADDESKSGARQLQDQFRDHIFSTRVPVVSKDKLLGRPEAKLQLDSRFRSPTSIRPAKITVMTRESKERQADKNSKDEEPSDFRRAMEEKVRQQIELQLNSNTAQGRRLTESLSSYFGQPVKLTASISRSLSTTMPPPVL